MEIESYKNYVDQYGPLRIHTMQNPDDSVGSSSMVFNEDTVLSRNGYSTSLPFAKRRECLIAMMENGISKSEIKDVLVRHIARRGNRYPDAADIWRSDLKFVDDYKLSSQNRLLWE